SLRRSWTTARCSPVLTLYRPQRSCYHARRLGELPEWSNGTDSKSVVPARVPRVRIPGSPPTIRNPSLGWGFCFSGGASLEYCRQSGDSRLDQGPLFFGCLPCAHPYLTALLRLWTHNMLKTMLPRLLS